MRHDTRAPGIVFGIAAGLLLGAAVASAQGPAADRVLPADQHTTDKARRLAERHAPALAALNAQVYHCLPWVEVHKQSIGFYRPKHSQRDDRYLSIRIYIEQDPSPAFASLAFAQRASAMFSRYVGPMLRRMTRDRALAADREVDGFTVILEWLKQGPAAAGPGGRPIHETIAVFVERPLAVDYLAGRARIGDVAARAVVLGFDGETPLGRVRLNGWEDGFVSTHRVANYQLAPGVTCQ